MKLLCKECGNELENVDTKEETIDFENNKIWLRGWFSCPNCHTDYSVYLSGTCNIESVIIDKD